MYLLSSLQILAAVRRSLEAHVLAEVEGFARVQVAAALPALDEVIDRLRNGDPLVAATERLVDALGEAAGATRDDEPSLADALGRVLDEHRARLAAAPATPGGEPRDRYRALVDAVWALIAGSGSEGAARVRGVLEEKGEHLLASDLRWMCDEAVASLR